MLSVYYRRRRSMGDRIWQFPGPWQIQRADDSLVVADCQILPPPRPERYLYRADRSNGPQELAWDTSVARFWRAFYFLADYRSLIAYYDQNKDLVAYKCDLATPAFWHAGALYQTDLELDIFVLPGGMDYLLVDVDEFEEAVTAGTIDPAEAESARSSAERLIACVEEGAFLSWLNRLCPHPFAPPSESRRPLPAHRKVWPLVPVPH